MLRLIFGHVFPKYERRRVKGFGVMLISKKMGKLKKEVYIWTFEGLQNLDFENNATLQLFYQFQYSKTL